MGQKRVQERQIEALTAGGAVRRATPIGHLVHGCGGIQRAVAYTSACCNESLGQGIVRHGGVPMGRILNPF